jgi:hypothetical protein
MNSVIHFFKNLDARRKTYINVFWGLCFLTVLELAFLKLPFSQTIITILVCVASLAKAVVVGWVYMHLNHETKGLKVLLLFPLFVAFFYAIFLIWDAPNRQANKYFGEPARVYGKRTIVDRQVDEFGNTIEPVVVSNEHAQAEHHDEAKKEAATEEPAKEVTGAAESSLESSSAASAH